MKSKRIRLDFCGGLSHRNLRLFDSLFQWRQQDGAAFPVLIGFEEVVIRLFKRAFTLVRDSFGLLSVALYEEFLLAEILVFQEVIRVLLDESGEPKNVWNQQRGLVPIIQNLADFNLDLVRLVLLGEIL